jgi:hypothetical protein
MSRTSSRRATGIQGDNRPSEPAAAAEAAPETPRVAFGWWVALVVWALGLGGLALYELGKFVLWLLR